MRDSMAGAPAQVQHVATADPSLHPNLVQFVDRKIAEAMNKVIGLTAGQAGGLGSFAGRKPLLNDKQMVPDIFKGEIGRKKS